MSENNSWFIDPETRDYVLDDKGKPVQDKTLKTPSHIRFRAKREGWLYAPNNQWGSDFHLLKRNHTSASAKVLENVGQKALAPIITEGRATETEIEIIQQTRHGAQLRVKITDAEGEPQEIVFTKIGV